MPNWCSNSLIVDGDQKSIDDFKSKTVVTNESGNEDFTMGILLPTPKELEEMTSPVMWRGDESDKEGKETHEKYVAELVDKYGHADWYNWRLENWGTKWDVAESWISDDEDGIFSVQYDTAWSPNITWVNYVSTLYPTLSFKLTYEEPGCGFCGCYEVKNGGEDFESLLEGDLEWQDDDGREVYYDSDKSLYRYCDTDELIEDEDFWAQPYNPYIQ